MRKVTVTELVELLLDCLSHRQRRKENIASFQAAVWKGEVLCFEATVMDIFDEIAYDLDYYEPDERLRREDLSFYGDDRLEIEIKSALEKLRGRGVEPKPRPAESADSSSPSA